MLLLCYWTILLIRTLFARMDGQMVSTFKYFEISHCEPNITHKSKIGQTIAKIYAKVLLARNVWDCKVENTWIEEFVYSPPLWNHDCTCCCWNVFELS